MTSKQFDDRSGWEMQCEKPIPIEIPDELLEKLGMKKPPVKLTRQERRKLKRQGAKEQKSDA